MDKRNTLVDFFRIIFTLIICLHHSSSLSQNPIVLKHGYMCVEFFFILSGFLLYKKFKIEKEHSTWKYLLSRIRRLYPDYLFACIMGIIVLGFFREGKINISKAVSELLMVQNTGLFHMGGYNYPCWYMAVMMVGGIIIYSFLLVREKDFVYIAAPLLILAGYTYLIGLDKGIEAWGYVGPISQALLRGLCGMTIGVEIAAFRRRHNIRCNSILLFIIEMISLLFIFIEIFTNASSEMLTVFAFSMLIWSITSENGNHIITIPDFAKKSISLITTYCYPAYLNHGLLIRLLSVYKGKIAYGRLLVIFFVLLVIYSVFTHKFTHTFVKHFMKKVSEKTI